MLLISLNGNFGHESIDREGEEFSLMDKFLLLFLQYFLGLYKLIIILFFMLIELLVFLGVRSMEGVFRSTSIDVLRIQT